MTWKGELAELISRTWRPGQSFTLKQVYHLADDLKGRHPANLHPEAKVRQTLQYLRDEGLISFVDGGGTYLRLR
jgi:hypothetical protein